MIALLLWAMLTALATAQAPQKAMLMPQVGNTDDIEGLALSADGRIAVTAADNWHDQVVVWETESGRVLSWLTSSSLRPDGPVAMSEDARIVAAIGHMEVAVWDRQTGHRIGRMVSKQGDYQPTAVAVAPGGEQVAVGLRNGTFFITEVELGVATAPGEAAARLVGDDALRTIDARTDLFRSRLGQIHTLAFAPQRGPLALGGGRGAGIWQVTEERWQHRHLTGLEAVRQLIWTEGGAQLLLTSGATLWAMDPVAGTGTIQQAFAEPPKLVRVSRDGRVVATATKKGTLAVWRDGESVDLDDGDHGEPIGALALSSDGTTLWAGRGAAVASWALGAQTSAHPTLASSVDAVETTVLSADGRTLALAVASGPPALIDLQTGRVRRLPLEDGLRVHTLAMDLARGRIAGGASDGTVRIWSTDDLSLLGRLRLPNADDAEATVPEVAFDATRGRIVACGAGGALWVWEDVDASPASLAWRKRPKRPAGRCLLRAAPHNSQILVGQRKAEVSLVDLDAEKVLGTWDAHTRTAGDHRLGGTVRSLGFSPDGSALFASWSFHTLVIDTETRKPVRTVKGTVLSLAGPWMVLDDNIWDRKQDYAGGLATWPGKQTLVRRLARTDHAAMSGGGGRIVVASSQGLVTIRQGETGEPLLYLALLRDGGWTASDLAGRFDGSDGGDSIGLHWVVGDEVLALQQLRARFYHPALLGRVLEKGAEALRPVEGLDEVALHPGLRITQGPDGIHHLDLSDRGGGIGPVQVLLNGKEIHADARALAQDAQSTPDLRLSLDLREHSHALPGVDNRLEVRAFNAQGYLSGRGFRDYAPAPARSEDPELPAFHGIFVGVSDYAEEAIDLRYGDRDARDMAQAIGLGARAYFGEDQVHLHLLTSDSEDPAQLPTRANIARVFEEVRKAASTDVLFVYLAGHGVSMGGAGGDYWYLTRDAAELGLSDPVLRAQVAVSSAELTSWFAAVPANKQALIADTCASGRLAEQLVASRGMSASQQRRLERMKDQTGTWVLAGAAASASSYEDYRYGGGVLTQALLLGMRGPALREGGYVDIGTLFAHARNAVPQLAAAMRTSQEPVVLTGGALSIEVGRLSPEDQAQVPVRGRATLVGRPTFMSMPAMDDPLGLEAALAQALRDVSEADAGIVFVDAGEATRAVKLRGTYTLSDDTVSVTAVVDLPDGSRQELTLEHAVEDDAKALAQAIVAALLATL